MTMTPTAADVLRTLVEGVREGRWEDLAALYADEAVVEHPLGLPERTRARGPSGGRRALRRSVRNADPAATREQVARVRMA
jgi:hypothetical protein